MCVRFYFSAQIERETPYEPDFQLKDRENERMTNQEMKKKKIRKEEEKQCRSLDLPVWV